MRSLAIAATLALLPVATAAAAAPVTIRVVGVDGRPLAGAVVMVTVPGTPPPPVRGPYTVGQRDIQFTPQLAIVPVGATVSFPNFDKVRHHVYSFSKAKKFELKLFGREESRSVTFDKPGAVALGCNIHDAMNGVIYVTASPYTAVTDADGRVRMNIGQSSAATVSVWHPSIRAADHMLSQRVAISPAGLSTTMQLRR
jgi:plastocyanin